MTSHTAHTSPWVRSIPATTCPSVIIDAPHAAAPMADPFTGEVAEAVARQAGCHCLIALQSREIADLNRPRRPHNAAAHDAHRAALRSMLAGAGVLDGDGQAVRPIFHLAVHAMEDRGWAMEVGSAPYDDRHACGLHVRDWFATQLYFPLKDPSSPLGSGGDVWVDEAFIGDPSLQCHRHGDPDPEARYPGFGQHYHAIQLEICASLLVSRRSAVMDLLATIARQFDCYSQSIAANKSQGGTHRG